jgi:hypothetical protein
MVPVSNADETLILNQPDETLACFIGNFHKTLPHNEFGEVDPAAYHIFRQACLDAEGGTGRSFAHVPDGSASFAAWHNSTAITNKIVAKFTSPMAGASREFHGPDPKTLEMSPAPSVLSASTAAEMVELYWMASLRDEPLNGFSASRKVLAAVADLNTVFSNALTSDNSTGALKLGLDLPLMNGRLDMRVETLFRCGLEGEDKGPIISQFFMQDIPYGVQTISTKLIPYKEKQNFLTTWDEWLHAQNTGKDKFGRDYGGCNNYADQLAGHVTYYPAVPARHISTLRDLARFVNRDALHQAYFNAALFLDAIDAPLDSGNPYLGASREGRFATLGGPDLLTLVSEVASRALKVIWRQKWYVHRRCRPEVYGGLLHAQNVKGRTYGVSDSTPNIFDAALGSFESECIDIENGQFLLPMAFSAGSPSHPSYGAGHATVAGACVTVLKAWFDETEKLKPLIVDANNASKIKDPSAPQLGSMGQYTFSAFKFQSPLISGARTGVDLYDQPTVLLDGTEGNLTVGGELNKLASNVAMGRSIGGVHWRSDNTRSLRLGEKIAMEILRKRTLEYAERPCSFTFKSFDRQTVTIYDGVIVTNP